MGGISPTSTVEIAARIGADTLVSGAVNWIALAAIVLLVIALVVWRLLRSRNRFLVDKVQFNAPFGLGNVTIRPTIDVRQLAHEAWTELVTRKAALPFDPKHDTIVDIYSSWYAMFGEVRSLVRNVPASSLSNGSDAEELVRLLVGILNEGVRPHLTCWQARFRRWYDCQAKDRPRDAPQAIQRDYPEYAQLEADLIQVSAGLADFADDLHRIAVRGG